MIDMSLLGDEVKDLFSQFQNDSSSEEEEEELMDVRHRDDYGPIKDAINKKLTSYNVQPSKSQPRKKSLHTIADSLGIDKNEYSSRTTMVEAIAHLMTVNCIRKHQNSTLHCVFSVHNNIAFYALKSISDYNKYDITMLIFVYVRTYTKIS